MADFFLPAFEKFGDATAIIWRDQKYSYDWLRKESIRLEALLTARADTRPGTIVALSADYSPRSLALLFANLRMGNVVAPLTAAFDAHKEELFRIAEAQTAIVVDDRDELSFVSLGHEVRHPVLEGLLASGGGGLVLFSSGSAGKMKAIVHDGPKLLAKYRTPRQPKVTIPFMLFDHIGGVHTILHLFSSGGTAVITNDRSPKGICELVARHRVQVLPTTPTFLNLLLLGEHPGDKLDSLEFLVYSAERMPPATLARLGAAFPKVAIAQNYGLSELGVMRTKTESSESLYIKIDGDGVQTRIRDGLLEIKSPSAMIGYLNEESPFTEDGWFKTQDRVEIKGDWVQVLGRQSEIIIVGGEKVYPAEVEDLIAQMPGVIDVVVYGEANAIAGQIVKAEVQLATTETRSELFTRMSAFLTGKVPPFKIPQRVAVGTEPLFTARMKKKRR